MSSLATLIKRIRIRPLAIGVFLAMIVGAAANAAMTPRIHVADTRDYNLEALVPKSFAGWKAIEPKDLILPDPSAQTLVNKIYNVVLTRVYERGPQIVMLVIAYGGDQSDALQLHRPEVCYAANGFAVKKPYYDDRILAGREIHLARVRTRDNYVREPVTYWMRVGNRQVTTNADRQIAKLTAGLHGYIPDGVLVRVSTRSLTDDSAAQYKLQDQFIADMLASLSPSTQELLLGAKAMGAASAGS